MLLSPLFLNICEAQQVSEPPIPIYIVYPNQKDSLRAAQQKSLTNNSAILLNSQRIDTLQTQLQKSTAENTAHFAWLYALIALLGTINFALLYVTFRMKKELAELKGSGHQHSHR